jgi:hypothetical protein
MDYTTWMLPTQAMMDREEGAEAPLYEALHHLQDARRGQGKRYSLALILCLLVLAKLAGQTTLMVNKAKNGSYATSMILAHPELA